jgi:biopolymer transport protein ExbD
LATWDVFRSDRLEIVRALSTEAVRAALARGEFQEDDLFRPAGTTVAWSRLTDLPVESAPPAPTSSPPPSPTPAPAPALPSTVTLPTADQDSVEILEVVEDLDELEVAEPSPPHSSGLSRLDLHRDLSMGEPRGRVDLSSVELVRWDTDTDEADPLDEDEEAASFTLSRDNPERVEELDLAAMVDVAFQLVLFFLVTAWQVVLFKSLEVPRPSPEAPAAGATQGQAQTLNDLKNDYILVEIDAAGAMKLDREPIAADMAVLVERLRATREATGRKAMLLSADSVTPHRNAVLAYDAANEIGLGIAIARPTQKGNR